MLVKNLLKLALLGSTWVMYLLLGLSVISIAAIVERTFFFRRGADEDIDAIGDKLRDYVERGEYEAADAFLAKSKSVEASIVRPALKWAHGGPEALADAIDAEMSKRRKDIERGINLLGTLGNNAPFIGLFGTVIGVIEAFAHLGAGQDKNAMANVMSGIAEALIATGVGLFVAIPAVIAYNAFQKKIGEIEENVTGIAKQLGALLHAVRNVGEGGRVHHAARAHERAEAKHDHSVPARTSVRAIDVAS